MKLQDIHEATISTKSVGLALPKIISYISRKLGVKYIRIPGIEHFHNSAGNGYGMRYVQSGTTKCIRINWNTEGSSGSSSSIHSIDIFNGTSRDPNFTIHVKGLSFVQALPQIVSSIRNPVIGRRRTFPISPVTALSESVESAVVTEASRDDYTSEEALDDFLKRLLRGDTFTRIDFIKMYHLDKVGIFDAIIKDFSDKFIYEKRRVSIASNTNVKSLRDSILSKSGIIETTKGGTNEEYLKTEQEEEVEEASHHVPFSDTLEHLESLTQALIKGSFNALFVAGRGGTGKTQTVEQALHSAGLSDGKGYFKNSGSASAPGVYTLLYHHRNDIILFDDSDGALKDVDARNIIKAATDTKKNRKLVWNKKSSFIFNPDEEDAAQYEDELSMAPAHFDFKGRIIFISNLPLKQLDPDGALRTRAFVVNVDPTDSELFDHMGKILMDIRLEDGLNLNKSERDHVLTIVRGSKRKGDVSLRKLVRALNLAASGSPNWEKLVDLYA